MPDLHSAPARLLLAGVLLVGGACAPASPAAAQELAARVAAAPDGAFRFSYPSREGVCGSGDGVGFRDPRAPGRHFTLSGSWSRGDDASGRERACVPGPLHVELALRSGEVTGIRARVGAAPTGAVGAITDAGTVPAERAARYLLALAERGTPDSETALSAAVLAEGVDLSTDLLRIGRDERVDEAVRGHAIFALGQTREAEDAAFLRDLYPSLASRRLKEQVIFSLSQVEGQGSDRWLAALAANEGESAQLREKAIFWLAETGTPLSELDALYARLRSTSLKEQVVFAYSRRDEPAATDRLLRLARTDPDQELRGKAVFWLGQAAGREITRDLAGLASDQSQNRGVQEQAVFAISQRPAAEGVPALVQIARTHRDPEIRKKALFWLGQSEDPRALELFEEILSGR